MNGNTNKCGEDIIDSVAKILDFDPQELVHIGTFLASVQNRANLGMCSILSANQRFIDRLIYESIAGKLSTL